MSRHSIYFVCFISVLFFSFVVLIGDILSFIWLLFWWWCWSQLPPFFICYYLFCTIFIGHWQFVGAHFPQPFTLLSPPCVSFSFFARFFFFFIWRMWGGNNLIRFVCSLFSNVIKTILHMHTRTHTNTVYSCWGDTRIFISHYTFVTGYYWWCWAHSRVYWITLTACVFVFALIFVFLSLLVRSAKFD